MTTTWWRVFQDETESRVVGLFRRRYDETGRGIGDESYHPQRGWIPNDYWLQIARGEPDDHLVEVSEDQAWETVLHFDRMWAGGDPRR